MRILSVIVSCCVLVACSQQKGPSLEAAPASPTTGPLERALTVDEVLSHRPDSSVRFPEKARLFLVAGSGEAANFGQEIVDQIRLWKKLGFTEEDIACYFSIPDQATFAKDEKQYTDLAPELKNCYPASPELLWKHLAHAAERSDGSFLYLYVTAHGAPAPSVTVRNPNVSVPQKQWLKQLVRRVPESDQYMIGLDSLIDGTPIATTDRFRRVIENGESLKNHLFTPKYLKEALNAFSPELPKYVAIQGCYSGGFLETDIEKNQNDTLQFVDNVSVITAARNDRPSFGCSPGTDRTAFGHYYNQLLEENGVHPTEIDWAALHSKLSEVVSKLEIKHRFQPSEPQFFTNRRE
jgi:hypothetical protein